MNEFLSERISHDKDITKHTSLLTRFLFMNCSRVTQTGAFHISKKVIYKNLKAFLHSKKAFLNNNKKIKTK